MTDDQNKKSDQFGFQESDFAPEGFAQEPPEAKDTADEKKAQRRAENEARKELRRRNLRETFGRGPGRIALVSMAIAFVLFGYFGYSGLSSNNQEKQKESRVEFPSPPPPDVRTAPVTQSEAARLSQRARLEADQARNEGDTYQSALLPVRPDTPRSSRATGVVVFPDRSPGQGQGRGGAASLLGDSGESTIGMTREQVRERQRQQYLEQEKTRTQTAPAAQTAAQKAQAETQARTSAEQEKKYEEIKQKYIDGVRSNVLTQADALFTRTQGLAGNYRASVFSVPLARAGNLSTGETGGASSAPSRRVLIKTGNVFYATLDSEVNTDDGGVVLATVKGGEWDGSKLIGKIEQAPNNIRLHFGVLAPQDHRGTVQIDAIALREEDAKQGVAENIDRHILERYSSLFVASALTGLGQAATVNPGTTQYLPNGSVTTTTDALSDRRIIGYVAGEVGRNAGSEIRRGFHRPTTFSTPAEKGFGVYFLKDVVVNN